MTVPRLLLVALAVTLVSPACRVAEELAIRPIQPVLDEELALESKVPKKMNFSLGVDGVYRLMFSTSLRNGAGSVPEMMELPVRVEVIDREGRVQLDEDHLLSIGRNQVGGTITSFGASDWDHESQILVISLDADDQILHAYQGFRVWLKREPKVPIFD